VKTFSRTNSIVGAALAFAMFAGCSSQTSQSQFGVPAPATRHAPSPASKRTVSQTVLYGFDSPGPYSPVASLISDSSGALYGTLQDGGDFSGLCYDLAGCGGVFKLTPNGSRYTMTMLYEFKGMSDGAGPFDNLYMDSSGALYGTAAYAGATNCGVSLGCGVVFKLSPSGSTYDESTIYTFKGGTDGASPVAGLIANAAGALFGTTQGGGNSAGDGTVFKLTAVRHGYHETILHRFAGCAGSASKDCDGANPSAPLYMNAAGDLLGTTIYGGAYECPANNLCGTAFELTPSGKHYKERVIYDFKGGSDGANSQGALIADSHGNLYGTTTQGGGANESACNLGSIVRGCGTVFELTPKKKGYRESVLYAFKGGSDAAAPQAGLTMDPSGALYGTTQLGGYGPNTGGYGTVFELAPSGSGYSESVVFSFICNYSLCTGQAPRAGLLEISGTFYGTTFQGGGGYGEVFRLTP
jgi:uncharacterized repeat protein (TIGR03803 family)